MSDPRRVFNECPSCGGDRGWEENTGFIDRECGGWITRWIACDECGATGSVEEDAVLIDEDDLDAIQDKAAAT